MPMKIHLMSTFFEPQNPKTPLTQNQDLWRLTKYIICFLLVASTFQLATMSQTLQSFDEVKN